MQLPASTDTKVFKFSDRLSFDSSLSSDFAEILSKSSGQVRTRLSKNYGISLRFDSDPIRITHDGRKIGIGSFKAAGVEIHFSILPKEESIALTSLIEALSDSTDLDDYVRFERKLSHAPTSNAPSDFSFSFQKQLLEKILKSIRDISGANNSKKLIHSIGGIKGRPLISRSISNLLLARTIGIQCEVLDSIDLAAHITVLFATARSLNHNLSLIAQINPKYACTDLNGIYKQTISRFPNVDVRKFNRSILYKVCRPPYPFGLKNVLSECLLYWMWKGNYSIGLDKNLEYEEISIDLDMLFERYVGLVFEASAGHAFIKKEKSSFAYYLSSNSDTITQTEQRKIIPDFIFTSRTSKALLIVDAKYRNVIATSDQVAQIISYLEYQGYDAADEMKSRVGILAYPGERYEVSELGPFSRKIYAVKIPIKSTLKNEELGIFLSKIIS